MIPAYEVMQYVGEKPYDTLNMLVFPGEGTYVHYQDNGSDFAYQGGAYNQYAFTQQENGEVTRKVMRDLTKRLNTFLSANKAEAGTREKMAAYLIVM